LASIGRDPFISGEYKRLVDETGFEATVERVIPWPLNPWLRDPQLKEVGA
jgi:hypothetical protein